MGTKSILVIDDNELNIKLIKGLFKKRKPEYVILEAVTAEDGIKIAFENIPDLILISTSGYERLGCNQRNKA